MADVHGGNGLQQSGLQADGKVRMIQLKESARAAALIAPGRFDKPE